MDTQREQTAEEYEMHVLRKEVDVVIQHVGAQKPVLSKGQREIAIAYTKLQEAKMWLGKVLEELGSELPKEYQDKAE